MRTAVLSKCGICGDGLQQTNSALVDPQPSGNSSAETPLGICLPCPSRHTYCIGCLSQHIMSKLDPDSNGKAPERHIIFPIRCPDCDLDQWSDGIQKETAKLVLKTEDMVTWVRAGLE